MRVLARLGPQLPPELTDRVIDYLHDSPADLRSCAQVCRAWLASSRFHLFYSISIEPLLKHSCCCNLYNAIQQSPDIVLYVRELRCSFIAAYDSGVNTDHPPSILPQLLRSFPALRKLGIAEDSWVSFSPDVRQSFRDILALPSLVHLEVSDVHFPKLEHFTSLLRPHLKRLDAWIKNDHDDDGDYGEDEEDNEDEEDSDRNNVDIDIDIDDDDDDATIQANQEAADREIEHEVGIGREPCRLQYLTLSPSRLCIQFINLILGSQSVVDLSDLHTLECDIDEVNFLDKVMRLTRGFGSPVKHLIILLDGMSHLPPWSLLCTDVALTDYCLDITDVIEFGWHPNLQKLSLSLLPEYETTPYLPHMFSTLSAPNLQHISFELSVSCLEEDTTQNFWFEVDQILCGEKYVSLRTVTIHLMERSQSDIDIRQIVVSRLPLMIGRGLLRLVSYGHERSLTVALQRNNVLV
jgi:hypothetical protein